MADQIVITEKSSQAKDVRAAVGSRYGTIPVPDPPVIRKGASGTFYDKGLEGASHHAVIPNVNTIDKLREVWPRLSRPTRKNCSTSSRGPIWLP